MGFGQFNSASKQMSAMSDINVTPMVDVMLVLLVIFIITAPLMNHAIKLDLPKAQATTVAQKEQAVTLSLDAQGSLFLEGEPLKLSDLDARLALLAKTDPQSEILLRADKDTRYEVIAQVMASAQTQGLSKIGFVTEEKLTGRPGSVKK